MRLFKASYRDRKGTPKKSGKWYVEFPDQRAIVRRFPGFTSKPASEELGRNLDKLVSYHAASGGQTDPTLQRWLTELPSTMRRKLVRIGLVDPQRVAVDRSLDDHADDFSKALKAKGNTPAYVDLLVGRLRAVLNGCGFRFWADISASKVESYLDGLRQGKNGISPQTFNFYLQAVKQFCRWMVRDRRANESPLAHLQGLNVRLDRRHDRRALSIDELRRLITAADGGSERFGVSGAARALLYRVAAETGLRAGELRSLTVASFELVGGIPTVVVAAAYSKNRRESVLMLKSDTVQRLKAHLAGRKPDEVAFNVPPRQHVAKMIRADVEAAHKAWLKEGTAEEREKHSEDSDFLKYRDSKKLVADFHALRHTFISNLAAGGVHPKTAQALARHSTFALTMERYSHSQRDAESAALQTLPDLSSAPVALKKEEASNVSHSDESVLADCLLENGGLKQISVDSGGLKASKGTKSEAGYS